MRRTLTGDGRTGRRRLLAVLASVGLAAGGMVAVSGAPAVAASPAVVVMEPVQVDGDTATVDYSINRQRKAIKTRTCALNGNTVGCGYISRINKKSTKYRVVLSGLADGDYEFVVTLGLSDGGSATGTASFTIDTNEAPEANDDMYSTDEDTPLTVPVDGVLANDTDPDGDGLTAILVTGPSDGALVLEDDGSFVYTPDRDFYGVDSFTYKASDGQADSIAQVDISVYPVNDAPVAVDDNYTTDEDTPLTVLAPGLLANDTDPDGDSLQIVGLSAPLNGTVAVFPNGSFTYTPNPGFDGLEVFSYTVTDGFEVDVATVTIAVFPGDT